MNQSSENGSEQIYRELYLGSELVKSLDESRSKWLAYFYDSGEYPGITAQLKKLVDPVPEGEDEQEYRSALWEEFKLQLETLIENRISELLGIEQDEDSELSRDQLEYLKAHWSESSLLLLVITEHYLGGKKFWSQYAKLIQQDMDHRAALVEKARTDVGLSKFMEVCDELAIRMAASEDKQFSVVGFLEDIKNLQDFKNKKVVDSADVLRMIKMTINFCRSLGDDESKEKARGYRRLLAVLSSREFFK